MLLYFLVDSSSVSDDPTTLEIGGRRWWLTSEEVDASQQHPKDFICISYTWGTKRAPNPFDASKSVSSNTIPGLYAAIHQRPDCHRFWIDAFCVPSDPDQKRFTLASMGFIYSQAQEVIVVLSETSTLALEQMLISDTIDEAALEALESEPWITRAWTYQEVVNSYTLSFTCASPVPLPGASYNLVTAISGDTFLNRIGYTLSKLPMRSFEKAQAYPSLSAFEDLIVDWMTAAYQERSALQVMANMDRRVQERAEDHFYAMIGPMTADLASLSPEGNACEEFMALCERKGDYSFIYSLAARSEERTKTWRPSSEGDLPAILPWHCWGEKQPGHWEDGALYLDEMVVLKPGQLGDEGEKFIRGWLTAATEFGSEDIPVEDSMFYCLEQMGFKSHCRTVDSSAGYLFLCEDLSPDDNVTLLVSASLRWTFGAPGMARWETNGETKYTAGIFVGLIKQNETSTVKMI
ncbi:hypothetical protein NA57DRAFT_79575 [Rhizodiscina lignyota]|uniref:Heterokaryon incompatibility domain-containing protein n=1 Tax=Rhizodiscina lignyota TaxID=1504668 RepID=A0A9P4IAP4_9PEZI|nr:hypothetical protein NA57DRAFT_79575 [Rhizodiscina lignyota]